VYSGVGRRSVRSARRFPVERNVALFTPQQSQRRRLWLTILGN
jgi:hypothetical protein